MGSHWRFLVEFFGSDAIGRSFGPITLPILFKLCLHFCHYKLTRSMIFYGIILSAIACGEVIGFDAYRWNRILSREFILVMMVPLIFLLSATSNIVIVMICCFLVSFFCAILRKWFVVYERSWKNVSLSTSLSGIFSANPTFFSSQIKNRRTLLTFSFLSLFACSLYNPSLEVSFPALVPLSYFAVFCFVTLILVVLCFVLFSKNMWRFGTKKTSPDVSSSRRKAIAPIVKLDVSSISEKDVPPNFLEVCGNDAKKALAMYIKTLQWRNENDADNILVTPQLHFSDILEMYPHAIHGRSLDNCVVLYEILGKARPRDLAAAGITTEDLVWHFNLRNEFVFAGCKAPKNDDKEKETLNKLNSSSNEFVRIMTVVDVKGISMRDVTSDVISFIQQSSEVMDSYYPGRVVRLVICNAPSWFYSVWSMIARVLPDSVRKKIAIIGDCKGLNEFIDPSQRPVDYGGTGSTPLGKSPEHLEFLEIPKHWTVDASPTSSPKLPTNRPGGPTDGNISSDSKLKSAWKWLSSRFQSNKATAAYLGEKNQFRYDEERGWLLDVSSNSSDVRDENDDSDDEDEMSSIASIAPTAVIDIHSKSKSDLEDHALLLAIEAAQSVSIKSRNEKRSNASPYLFPTSKSAFVPSSFSATMSSHPAAILSSTSSYSGDSDGRNLSSYTFVIALSMFFMAAFLQCSLFTLISVFLYLPVSKGGGGYSTMDVGLLVSATSMIILLLDITWREKIMTSIRMTPLRCIRVLCLMLALSYFFFPFLFAHHSVSTDSSLVYGESNAVEVHRSSSNAVVTSNTNDWLPSYSIYYLPLPSFVLSLLVIGSSLVRAICAMLLDRVLSHGFDSPRFVIKTIHVFIDILGPILTCLLFTVILDNNLPFPMNACSFLVISYCVYMLLFILTLSISTQYLGDFGWIPDIADVEIFQQELQAHSSHSKEKDSCWLHFYSAVQRLGRIIWLDIRFFVASSNVSALSKLSQESQADLKDL